MKVLILVSVLAVGLTACHSKSDELAEQQMQEKAQRQEAMKKAAEKQKAYTEKWKERYQKANQK